MVVRVRAMRMTAAILALSAAIPAAAQTKPPCPARPVPAEYAGWTRPNPVADGGTLALGSGGVLALTTKPVFAVAPERPLAPDRFGGSTEFRAMIAGTYRVALGDGAWIDVIRDGKSVRSSKHGHGDPCSPVLKWVEFPLTPGRYTVQLSGAKSATARVLVTRKP